MPLSPLTCHNLQKADRMPGLLQEAIDEIAITINIKALVGLWSVIHHCKQGCS